MSQGSGAAPAVPTPAGAAAAFQAQREHLLAVAYRMLGSRSDADDAVQEAWLRYAATDRETIVDLRAWLTTVTGRICLDLLRSARVRREAYIGPWLPEPYVARLPAGEDPADRVATIEQVSIAVLLLLERLTAEQRVAFVLHDVFATPFEEIASVLGTSTANARQLASRARRAVTDGRARHATDPAEQQRVTSAFFAAAAGGDLDTLVRLLAPDVIACGDSGGDGRGPAARKPITGAPQVARFMLGLFRQAARSRTLAEPVLVNGEPGMLIQTDWPNEAGPDELTIVTSIVVDTDGRVIGIYNQMTPAKLRQVPALDPARAVDLHA